MIGYNQERHWPTGSTKEWAKAMGVTSPEQVQRALMIVRDSTEYRAMLGVYHVWDFTSSRESKNGTICFQNGLSGVKHKILLNGKIDVVHANGYHRSPRSSAKPHIIPNDPVGSIVASMKSSLVRLKKILDMKLTKRRDRNVKKFVPQTFVPAQVPADVAFVRRLFRQ